MMYMYLFCDYDVMAQEFVQRWREFEEFIQGQQRFKTTKRTFQNLAKN